MEDHNHRMSDAPSTPCDCPLAAAGVLGCVRHKIDKSPRHRELCQTRPKYFRQWETGRSPQHGAAAAAATWSPPANISRGWGRATAAIEQALAAISFPVDRVAVWTGEP